jgi:hypothetical protein
MSMARKTSLSAVIATRYQLPTRLCIPIYFIGVYIFFQIVLYPGSSGKRYLSSIARATRAPSGRFVDSPSRTLQGSALYGPLYRVGFED